MSDYIYGATGSNYRPRTPEETQKQIEKQVKKLNESMFKFKEGPDIVMGPDNFMIDSSYHGIVFECELGEKYRHKELKITRVVFNDPATIVFWTDGTKTVVKQQKCDKKKKFDPEKGLAMAIAKKALGNQGNYFNEFRKWVDTYEPNKKEKKSKKENK